MNIIKRNNKNYSYLLDGSEIVKKDWLFSYDSGESYGYAGDIAPVKKEWIGKSATQCCIFTNFFLKPV